MTRITGNILDKICKIKTHLVFSTFFFCPESHTVCGIIWNSQRGHRWQYNMAYAHGMLGNKGCRHTRKICNTSCFCTATVVKRTWLNITFTLSLPVLLIYMLKYNFILLFKLLSLSLKKIMHMSCHQASFYACAFSVPTYSTSNTNTTVSWNRKGLERFIRNTT